MLSPFARSLRLTSLLFCMLCPLLHVVGCCCLLLRKVWNRSNFSANNSQHFFCSVIAEAWRNNVGSVSTALPTLLGPRTLVTHGLQRLMGCILPTMHCRSQHWWELSHLFADHCQYVHNNSQHYWRNNVESCCVSLHAALDNFQIEMCFLETTKRICRMQKKKQSHKFFLNNST